LDHRGPGPGRRPAWGGEGKGSRRPVSPGTSGEGRGPPGEGHRGSLARGKATSDRGAEGTPRGAGATHQQAGQGDAGPPNRLRSAVLRGGSGSQGGCGGREVAQASGWCRRNGRQI